MNGRLRRDGLADWASLPADECCDVLWSVMWDDPQRAMILARLAEPEPAKDSKPDPATWGMLPAHRAKAPKLPGV